MRERTAAERVNNRILHHYGLKNSMVRGKKRISFFATVAAFNIHLDAQLAKLKAIGLFDFNAIFGLKKRFPFYALSNPRPLDILKIC